mgnify:FL=1
MKPGLPHRIYQPTEFNKLPWKNGLGFTTELLRQPAQGELFDWRLSIARVDQDGPFSNFAGYQRTLVLLGGNGITLIHRGEEQQYLGKRLASASFAGESPTSATLKQGPIEDFNIITRTGICIAQTHCDADLAGIEIDSKAAQLLVYASGDDLAINLGQTTTLSLPGGHLLAVSPQQAMHCVIEGEGYIAVEIHYTSESETEQQ